MNDEELRKELLKLTANQHAQSVYLQNVANLILAQTKAIREIILDVAEHSGMDRECLVEKLESVATHLDSQLSEFPFPEFEWPEGDEEPPEHDDSIPPSN